MRKQLPVGCGEYRRPGLGLIKFRHQLEVRGGAGGNFLELHGLFERQITRSAPKDDNLSRICVICGFFETIRRLRR